MTHLSAHENVKLGGKCGKRNDGHAQQRESVWKIEPGKWRGRETHTHVQRVKDTNSPQRHFSTHPRHECKVWSSEEQSWQPCVFWHHTQKRRRDVSYTKLLLQHWILSWLRSARLNSLLSWYVWERRSYGTDWSWYGLSYLDVVAPPIRSGILVPVRSISLATWIISSSEGVIRPDRPMMSKQKQQAIATTTTTFMMISIKTKMMSKQYAKTHKHTHTPDIIT